MTNGIAMPMKPAITLPAGFEVVRPQPRRIVAAIRGNAKEGKTALALDFPEPVLIFNFDFGYEAAAHYILQRNPGKSLHHFDMPISDDTTPTEMASILKKFQSKYNEALAYCDINKGTVIVDTASDLWRIVQEGVLGPIKATYEAKNKWMPQFEYGKANIIMAGILRKPFHYNNVNAVFIHRNRVVYEGGEPTQRTEGQWFGDTPAIVEHIFNIYEDQGDNKIKALIEVCRTDRTLRGITLTNPTFDLIWANVGPPEEEESGGVVATAGNQASDGAVAEGVEF